MYGSVPRRPGNATDVPYTAFTSDRHPTNRFPCHWLPCPMSGHRERGHRASLVRATARLGPMASLPQDRCVANGQPRQGPHPRRRRMQPLPHPPPLQSLVHARLSAHRILAPLAPQTGKDRPKPATAMGTTRATDPGSPVAGAGACATGVPVAAPDVRAASVAAAPPEPPTHLQPWCQHRRKHAQVMESRNRSFRR